MKKNKIIQLIKNYLFKVELAHQIFNKHYGIIDPFRAYRTKKIAKKGNIVGHNISIDYNFHGIGCLLTFENGEEVDFDYGPERQINGFDAWRVAKYANSIGILEFSDYNSLKSLFIDLEKEGYLKKMNSNGRLYVLNVLYNKTVEIP